MSGNAEAPAGGPELLVGYFQGWLRGLATVLICCSSDEGSVAYQIPIRTKRSPCLRATRRARSEPLQRNLVVASLASAARKFDLDKELN